MLGLITAECQTSFLGMLYTANCWRQTDVSTGTPLVVRTALTDNTLPRPDKGRMVSLDRVEPRARKTGI